MDHMLLKRLFMALCATCLMCAGQVGCGLGGNEDPSLTHVKMSIATAVSPTAAPYQINDAARCSGRARIYCYPDASEGDELCTQPADAGTLAGQCDLTIINVGTDSMTLDGNLPFELGPSGSRYRLEVELLELGDDVQGTFGGTISLDSGLEGNIDSLVINSADPFNARICLSSRYIEGSDDSTTCVDTSTDSLLRGSYDAEQNVMTLRYDVVDPVGSIHVEFRGGLTPTVIYRGCTTIEETFVGGAEPVDVEVALHSSDSRPGPDGPVGPYPEQLVGSVTVTGSGGDDEPPVQETGAFSMTRTGTPVSGHH